VYASRTRKEKFSGPGENCQWNVTDLAGSLVTSSRPLGRTQKRPDDRTSNAGVAVRKDVRDGRKLWEAGVREGQVPVGQMSHICCGYPALHRKHTQSDGTQLRDGRDTDPTRRRRRRRRQRRRCLVLPCTPRVRRGDRFIRSLQRDAIVFIFIFICQPAW